MDWWEGFVAWIEINPWRIGLAVTILGAPIVAILTAATHTGRKLVARLAVFVWKQSLRLGQFLRTVRLTTTTRIEREYDRRREAEIADREEPEYFATPPPPGWKLVRGKSRALWLLVNDTGERGTVTSIGFVGEFSIEQYPTLPRTIQPGGALRFHGNVMTSGFMPTRPRIDVTWKDAHGDQHTGSNEVADGVLITDSYF